MEKQLMAFSPLIHARDRAAYVLINSREQALHNPQRFPLLTERALNILVGLARLSEKIEVWGGSELHATDTIWCRGCSSLIVPGDEVVLTNDPDMPVSHFDCAGRLWLDGEGVFYDF